MGVDDKVWRRMWTKMRMKTITVKAMRSMTAKGLISEWIILFDSP